jgi:hypothetical protein
VTRLTDKLATELVKGNLLVKIPHEYLGVYWIVHGIFQQRLYFQGLEVNTTERKPISGILCWGLFN